MHMTTFLADSVLLFNTGKYTDSSPLGLILKYNHWVIGNLTGEITQNFTEGRLCHLTSRCSVLQSAESWQIAEEIHKRLDDLVFPGFCPSCENMV